MANAIRSILTILAVAAAGQALGYQVTGEVKEVSDSSITVVQEKGKNKGEKFEMARDAGTKVSGDLKKGSKVTVEYTLSAKSIEAKAEKADKGKKK